MHKDSQKFMSDIVGKVRGIKPEDRLEDGSVEISVNDNDIKTILGKKVLRSNLKAKLEEDLNSAGLSAKVCVTDEMKIVVPKDTIECKTIRYSDIKTEGKK